MILDGTEVYSYQSILASRKINVLASMPFDHVCAVYFMKDGPWYGLKKTTREESNEWSPIIGRQDVEQMRRYRSKFIENAVWFDNKPACQAYIATKIWQCAETAKRNQDDFLSDCLNNRE